MSRPRSSRKSPSSLPRSVTTSARSVWPLVIVAIGLVAYANSLTGPFIWDDQIAVVTNRTIQNLWPLEGALRPPPETPVAGRPLVNLSFAINYAAGGLNEFGYHLTNLAIHIACALLLFGIVRRTLTFDHHVARTSSPPLASLSRSANSAAVAVAALWMVHPLQSEVVNYVTQRSESLMGLCLLATLFCAIRGREAAVMGGGARGPNRRWEAASISACAAGMLAKESMVVAPLIVVLYDRAFTFESFSAALRARRSLYVGLAMTWTIVAIVVWGTPRSTVGASGDVGPRMYLVNQVEMISQYLRLVVWPRALVLDYGVPRSLRAVDVLAGAIVIGALIVATIVAIVKAPRIGFLAVAFFLTLAPTSSVIPIRSEVGAERRMYVPFMALAALVVFGGRGAIEWASLKFAGSRTGQSANKKSAGSSIQRLNAWSIATVVVLVALAARTMARNAEYGNPLALWRTVVDRRPHGRARMALATELATAGRHDEAIAQLRDAVDDFPNARAALGTELMIQGRTAEGVAVLQRFIADGPSLPNRIPAHILLAQGFASEGNLDQSAVEWRIVVAASPTNMQARAGLARVLSAQAQASLQRREADAAATFAREAVQLAPDDGTAHNLLGVALASNGDLVGAESQFREAVRLAPNDPQARANLERATGAPLRKR